MQSIVAVAVFILFFLHGADGGNLTTILETASDNEAPQNLSRLVGVKVKVVEQDEPFSGENVPPPLPKATAEKAAKVSEGHVNVRGKWESGWFVAGCYVDKKDDRDLPVGPFSITGSDPYPVCAGYCMDKGNRYAGLQLSPDDPSTVLCYCGLTVGRHGASRRCTVRCPQSTVETQVCGNKLANTVIYVYRVRRSTFQDLPIGTSALVIVALLAVNAAVITGFAIHLVLTAKRMLTV